MSKGKKAILIDLDGTLVDSAQDIRNGVNHTLQSFGLGEKSTEEVKAFIGDGVRNLIHRALSSSGGAHSTEQMEEALAIFSSYYEKNLLNHTRFYPGVQDTLEELSEDCFLFVVSNKRESYSRWILEGLGGSHFFEKIIGGDTLSERKPSPVSIHFIAREYSLDTSQMLFVGDHHTDLMAAKNGNVKSVYCSYGMGHPGEARPDYQIEKFFDLKSLDFFKKA